LGAWRAWAPARLLSDVRLLAPRRPQIDFQVPVDYTVAMTDENAKTIADYLLGQMEFEMAATRRVLSALPAGASNYKPSEKCMNGLELAGHIAASEVFFLRGVVNGKFEWAPPEFKTPAEALAYYEQQVPGLISDARALPGAQLTKTLTMGPMSLSGLDFLALNLKHSVHHRGQLSAYLRPLGSKVPSIYGPSGDAEKRATA
jgi:uncharacterized damage-inducible protein DinB